MTVWTKEKIEAEIRVGKRWVVLRGPNGGYRDLTRSNVHVLEPGNYHVVETTYEVIVHEKQR